VSRVADSTAAAGAPVEDGGASGPSARPPTTFVGIVFLVAVFNLLGLVMVLSASSVLAHDTHGSSWYYVSRQALWMLVGTVALVIVARVDYHRLRRLATPMLVLSLAALVVVLVPGMGLEAYGARRWLGTEGFTVQPSELVKLTLLIWVADLLARRAHVIHNVRATLRPVIVMLVLVSTLVLLEPDLGTTIVITAIALSTCFVAGVPIPALTRWSAAGLAVVMTLSVTVPYRRARVFSFLDPWSDPLDQGWQNIQSLVGLAEGGVAGTGLGASRAKWGFLPFAHTDFIFAIIGEELGLVGAFVVVMLFILLGVLGIRTALHAPDRFGMLLAVGVTTWFLVQSFVNIGVVIGVLPVAGVPLPFVSFGGSSLVVAMIGVGLLLSVARQTVPAPSASDHETDGGAVP
jgi:cell division protein FtsW